MNINVGLEKNCYDAFNLDDSRIGAPLNTVPAFISMHLADNLIGFFGLVAASFGPICGAMAADYIVAGRRWSGPRIGTNRAGCLAWLVGFLVGTPEHIPGLPAAWVKADNPPGLYSFAVGFVVYLVLAKLGFCPPVVRQLGD